MVEELTNEVDGGGAVVFSFTWLTQYPCVAMDKSNIKHHF
jgi:hypothetical protein